MTGITNSSGVVTVANSAFNAYTLRFSGDTTMGWYQWFGITGFKGGSGFYDLGGDITGGGPNTDNTYTLGASGARWTSVWASSGLNTSHSDFKREIQPLALTVEVPRGIMYRWKDTEGTDKDRPYIGFLADNLPKEAFEWDKDGNIDKTGVHTCAVIGIVCAAVLELQKEVDAISQEVDKLLEIK